MEPRGTAFIGEDEIAFSLDNLPGRFGRRFTMDIEEEVFRRMGQEGVAYAMESLSKQVVYENQHAIRSAVESFLHDREWAEPVIRQAIRDNVREIIRDMFDDLTDPTEGETEAGRET